MSDPQPRKLAPIDELRQSFMRLEPQFKMALPPQVRVEHFIRVVMTAVQNNPNLINLDRGSLFAACMQAAQDGLLPDGREGALVPYKGKVKWTAMVWGIVKKVRNSGELSSMNALVVYDRDEWEYWIDEEGEHFKHRPYLDEDRGNRRLAYAYARTKDGALYIETMTMAQILAVKNASPGKDSGPWAGDFEDEMIRKTVIRRLSKRLPMSTDVERVIQRDDDLYDFKKEPPTITVQPGQVQPQLEAGKPSRLNQILDEQDAKETEGMATI